jgi:uncharacterized SAM-dependent methyltransferase
MLDSLGLAPAQVQLTVSPHLLRPDGHIWQIRAEAAVRQPLQCTLYDETFAFAVGESLEVFFSTRFTPEVMPEVLAEAGLTPLQTFLFESQEEAIYLCTRA